jgi:hypothetical protein
LPAVVEPLEVLPPPELDVELEVELVLDELPDGFEQGSAFGRSPTRNPSSSSSSPSLQPLDDPPLEEPPLVDPPAPSLVPPEELPVSSLGQFAFVDEPPLGVLLSEHANRANGTSQQTARKFMTGLLVKAPNVVQGKERTTRIIPGAQTLDITALYAWPCPPPRLFRVLAFRPSASGT